MARQLRVELVSVERRVWDGEADMLVARTTEGELAEKGGVARKNAKLAEPSQVRVKREGEELAYDVTGGFLSVSEAGVTILAEGCQPVTSRPVDH